MDLSEELELVPPEDRHKYQQVHQSSQHVEQQVRQMATHSSEHYNREKLVYVTFFTHADRKLVAMFLNKHDALNQISRKAAELLPTIEWKVFSGTQHRADYEFQRPSQVWDAIKWAPISGFHYLLVRLERANPIGLMATCDSCRQSIHGHRFKCTECADFDICDRCEARSVHSDHAMLRIVNSGTQIPRYITANAPSHVFGHRGM